LKRSTPTTLIEQFHYPRLGPGQMWERIQEQVEERGIPVHLRHRVRAIHHDHARPLGIRVEHDGHATEVEAESVLSRVPLSALVLMLDPAPPEAIITAAERLRYRALCLVALVIDHEQPFPDNWIYLHDPGTRAGRVQNFGAWSDAMVRP